MALPQKLPPVPPWGPKWGPEALRAAKEGNPRMFDRGFAMRSFSDDELTFPHFAECCVHGVVLGDVQRRRLPAFVGVDLAGDKRPGNAIVVLGLEFSTRRRFVLDVLAGAWTSPQTAGVMAAVHAKHDVRFFMVENNAYQQSLIDWIRHDLKDNAFWPKIESFTTGKQKADPRYGLPSLEVEFKNKAWVIPADEFEGHPATCMCPWCTFSREFRTYPMGVSSDVLMASWFAREAIDRWGGTGSAMSTNTLRDINAR